jgi:hypothetical protein
MTKSKPKNGISPIFIVSGFIDADYIASRSARRQVTPPFLTDTENPSEQQTGVSRVNKEIATLIARKDPVLNQVSKKLKSPLSKKKKDRLQIKMIKAAAKGVHQSTS